MCQLCEERARKAVEAMDPTVRAEVMRQAIQQVGDENYDRGFEDGKDWQLRTDEHAYRRKVTPARDAILAAVDAAEADLKSRADNNDPLNVLKRLIANVKHNIERIPVSLPRA